MLSKNKSNSSSSLLAFVVVVVLMIEFLKLKPVRKRKIINNLPGARVVHRTATIPPIALSRCLIETSREMSQEKKEKRHPKMKIITCEVSRKKMREREGERERKTHSIRFEISIVAKRKMLL